MNNNLTAFWVTVFLLTGMLHSCSKKNNATAEDAAVTTPTPPNIIFIIADDMGWDVFGNSPGIGGTKAITPTLDSLARNGISFSNYWVNPVCAPTRAAMLTGKYAFRTGVGGVQTPANSVLKNTETIIQQYINDKTSDKYATALIGKWHLSSTAQLNAPESFGIQYYSGIFSGAVADYSNWTQTSGGIQQNISTYSTTHLVNQSISWVKQQQTKPFFLWLAFNAPHTPFHRPPLNLISNQALADNVASINSNPFPYYLSSIEAMDKEIARLLSSLSETQKENTVFIFMGDNGTPSQVAQAPFASNGSKSTLFQGGINTPLVVCGKNITRKHVVETAMIQAPDIFTTLADIAGAGDEKYQDGISFKPLFTNANATKRTFVYTEQFGNTAIANDGYAIRNAHYKLIHLQSGAEYLYKISADPFEQFNLLTTALSIEAQQNLDQLRIIKAGL